MPKWKHVLNEAEFAGKAKERRGPHHSSRRSKRIKVRDRRPAWAKKKGITPPRVPHIHTIPVTDTKTGRDRCRHCGAILTFEIETLTGRLLRLELDGCRHRHQDG